VLSGRSPFGLDLLRLWKGSVILLRKTLVLLISMTLVGCGALNATERYLPIGGFRGRLVVTHASNETLEKLGYQVLRRFKSLPNIVQVGNFDRFLPGSLIEDDPSIQRMIVGNKKGHSVQKKLLPNLRTSKKPLVSIIDSGVVPSTPALVRGVVRFLDLTSSSDTKPSFDHATAIASLFAGVEMFGEFKNGAAPGAQLMSVRVGFVEEEEGLDNMLQLAVALDESIALGADVVNLSLSYNGFVPQDVQLLEQALISAGALRNVVFVSAAGNDGQDLTKSPRYPARYDLHNLVVVGNLTSVGHRAQTSNFGDSVDLFALGENVTLNLRDGGASQFSGTSFAAPRVAAALAVSFEVDRSLPWWERLDALYATAFQSQSRFTTHSSDEASSSFGKLEPGEARYGTVNAEGFLLSLTQRFKTSQPIGHSGAQ
jgi:subtilisin family serine protease